MLGTANHVALPTLTRHVDTLLQKLTNALAKKTVELKVFQASHQVEKEAIHARIKALQVDLNRKIVENIEVIHRLT